MSNVLGFETKITGIGDDGTHELDGLWSRGQQQANERTDGEGLFKVGVGGIVGVLLFFLAFLVLFFFGLLFLFGFWVSLVCSEGNILVSDFGNVSRVPVKNDGAWCTFDESGITAQFQSLKKIVQS